MLVNEEATDPKRSGGATIAADRLTSPGVIAPSFNAPWTSSGGSGLYGWFVLSIIAARWAHNCWSLAFVEWMIASIGPLSDGRAENSWRNGFGWSCQEAATISSILFTCGSRFARCSVKLISWPASASTTV